MSELNNDTVMEEKLEAYREYLNSLPEEFLRYEFADRLKYSPEEYFSDPKWAQKSEEWIESLLDTYAVHLFHDDIEANWVNKEYLKEGRRGNLQNNV